MDDGFSMATRVEAPRPMRTNASMRVAQRRAREAYDAQRRISMFELQLAEWAKRRRLMRCPYYYNTDGPKTSDYRI